MPLAHRRGRRPAAARRRRSLHLRIGITDITSFPDQIDGVQAIKLLNAKWPQGSTETLEVAVTDYDQPGDAGGGRPRSRRRPARSRASATRTVTPSKDGKVALVSFTIAGAGQNDPASQAIVREVRSTTVPGGVRRPPRRPGLRHRRRRPGARRHARSTPTRSRSVFAFVLGLSFLLLLVVFHSIVIPIKAILLNLLSTGAAYGVVVAVFQDDILHGPLGIEPRASSRAGSRSSSSRSCSASRWTTTCSS